jgi:hypothetical protein
LPAGVILELTGISLDVNGARGPPTDPDANVPVDFIETFGPEGLDVWTGPAAGDIVYLKFEEAMLRAAGSLNFQMPSLGLDFDVDIALEFDLSTSGIQLPKLRIRNFGLSLGGLNFGTHTGGIVQDWDNYSLDLGRFYITSQGIAGELKLLDQKITIGTVELGADLDIAFNTSPSAVTFNIPGYSKTLPAGPYFRFTAIGAYIKVAGVTLSGNFQFERVVVGSTGQFRLAATNVTVSAFEAEGQSGTLPSGGEAAFIIWDGGELAGIVRGSFEFGGDGIPVEVGSEVILGINTTGDHYS